MVQYFSVHIPSSTPSSVFEMVDFIFLDNLNTMNYYKFPRNILNTMICYMFLRNILDRFYEEEWIHVGSSLNFLGFGAMCNIWCNIFLLIFHPAHLQFFKRWISYYWILAKYPPSVGFPSPSGGVAPSAPIWETAAFGGGERIK